MIEPKEITVKTMKGDEKTYVIAKFPAVAGREIIAQYPASLLPKIGDYALNESLMLKVMAYVGIPNANGGEPLWLKTRALVDNHVPDWETLARIELEVMNYNTSFFQNGKASAFLNGLALKLQSNLTGILMGLSEKLSQAEPPHSKNFEQSTP